MKRAIKILLFALCLVLAGASLAACSQEEAAPEPEEIVEEVIEVETEIVAPGELSDDIFSFEFSLNGTVFALPFAYSEFYAQGWAFEDTGAELDPNQRTFTRDAVNNGETVGISIGNLTPNVIPYYEGLIGGVRVNEFDVNTGTQFILPGGISIGSTLEEVLGAYGEPNERNDTESLISLRYTLEIQSYVRIQFDRETEQVMEVEMTNFTERQQAEFDGDLPEIAQGYQAPAALGSDWNQGIVELDGTLYQLPAPLGVFLANGWELVSDNEMVPAGRTSVMRNIRNGNQVMRVDIKNYDRVEQPLVNGFVTKVEYSGHFWTGDIVLPGGITENSTYTEVQSAFGSYNRREENSMFTLYEFGSNINEQVRVTFEDGDGAIHSIVVVHELRDLPW